jgi:hypothetical protein
MTDEMNDWPYTELGSHPTPQMRIADLLRDQGWDDDIESVYGPAEDSDEYDELDYSFDPMFRDRCECRILKLFNAADELKEFFERNTSLFPRTSEQIENFRIPGGWAKGPWYFYVNRESSVPFDEEYGGSIHLFGCSKKGHSCRVVMDPSGVISIRAEKPELPVKAKSRDSEIEKELAEAREVREEELYDRRTYAELDTSSEDDESDEDLDLISIWRDYMAPESEISTFLEAGLEPEEVVQISRFMPRSQVSYWVEEFGRESMLALEYLKISIGGLSEREELDDIDFDSLRSRLAQAVREEIAKEFRKTEKSRRIIEKKKKSVDEVFGEDEFDDDEFIDLDNDPYWDD